MSPQPDTKVRYRFEAGPGDAGIRLDRWLAKHIPDVSRARIQALIKQGSVESDVTIKDAKTAVKSGAIYCVTLPEAEPSHIAAQPIDLNIVYEDKDLIVIDKPAGLVVHPAAGHADGTLVNALVAHCGDSLSGIGGIKRPGIVHRLDKDTSGILVVAKNDAAHQSLAEQFKSHGQDGRLHRSYLALAWGVPVRPKGVIDVPLSRSMSNRTKISVARGDSGRHAVTHYEVLEAFEDAKGAPCASLIRLVLETGRTHQIRVHLAHIRHPILGDSVYGTGFKTASARLTPTAEAAVIGLKRQALHAKELSFEHPRTGKIVNFSSDLPDDFASVLLALRAPVLVKKATEKARASRSIKR